MAVQSYVYFSTFLKSDCVRTSATTPCTVTLLYSGSACRSLSAGSGHLPDVKVELRGFEYLRYQHIYLFISIKIVHKVRK